MALFEAIEIYASRAAGRVYDVFSAPGSFLSPAPLAVALLIAAFVVMARRRRDKTAAGLGGVMREIMPPHILKHPSARRDVWIILINEGLFFFLPAAAAVAVGIARLFVIDVVDAGEAMARPPEGGFFSLVVFGVYITLVWDFFATYAHYLKHKVPILWEFHKVHHCAEVLTPLTALRRHPVEVVVGAVISGGGVAMALVFWALVFGAPGSTFEIGGVTAAVFLWRLLGYNIRHSHLRISYGPFWNNIFVSPAHHQLHHSREARHHDCNFGHIFSWWDRLFGTLYHPREGERFEFGIERAENEELRTLWALYIRPLRKAAARFAPRRAARAQPAE